MTTPRCRSLHLAGIDIALPAIVSIAGWHSQSARRLRIVMGFAAGHAEGMIAPLVQQWLLHQQHRAFVPADGGATSDIATAAFYDTFGHHFAHDSPIVAVLVLPQRGAFRAFAPDLRSHRRRAHGLVTEKGADPARDALGGLFGRTDAARWKFAGLAHCYLRPQGDTAQVMFDDLPGAIELIRASPAAAPPPAVLPSSNEAQAWYGFGVPAHSPSDIIATLRNGIHELPRTETESRAA